MVRDIQIHPVLNGYVVTVGCQVIVLKTPAELGAAVTEYYSAPEKTEARYLENRINDTMQNQIATGRDNVREPQNTGGQLAPPPCGPAMEGRGGITSSPVELRR